jgi:hypothetical protein
MRIPEEREKGIESLFYDIAENFPNRQDLGIQIQK